MTTHVRGPVFSEEGFVVGQGTLQRGTHFSGALESRGGFVEGLGLGQEGTHFKGPVFAENGFLDGPFVFDTDAGASPGTLVLTVPTGLTIAVGQKVVLVISLQGGDPVIASIIDSGGNNYANIDSAGRLTAYYADVTTQLSQGDTITIDVTTSTSAMVVGTYITGYAAGAPGEVAISGSLPVPPITVPPKSVAFAAVGTTSETSFKEDRRFSSLAVASAGNNRVRLAVRPMVGRVGYNPQIQSSNVFGMLFAWDKA